MDRDITGWTIRTVVLVSLRRIEAGEELFSLYRAASPVQ
jgi:hypothetical protein